METTPQKLEMFYEGKAKKLYSTSDPDLVIAYFKDDATAFNGKKKDTIEDKGVMNNRMSELFFTLLEKNGVKTHFVRRLNDREMLCKRLQIIPVETVVRNIVAGSMAKRLGRIEGEPLPLPRDMAGAISPRRFLTTFSCGTLNCCGAVQEPCWASACRTCAWKLLRIGEFNRRVRLSAGRLTDGPTFRSQFLHHRAY